MRYLYQWRSFCFTTSWWMARAYYKAEYDRYLFVVFPLNHVFNLAWRINLAWCNYRHNPNSWIEREIKSRNERETN